MYYNADILVSIDILTVRCEIVGHDHCIKIS